MEGINTSLKVTVVRNAQEAIDKGFVYRAPIKAVNISEVVVVQDGTSRGKSTVDLLLTDADGNRYVVMVTGALLKAIPC